MNPKSITKRMNERNVFITTIVADVVEMDENISFIFCLITSFDGSIWLFPLRSILFFNSSISIVTD
jgi:hypothetical protein